ncbi:Lrp/AsnC family transcriptional regulator [Streptomyces sp. NPDC002537]
MSALAGDGRAAVPELAAATGWSESTVRRRLAELRDSGALSFDVEIDPALYGFAFEAVLWLDVAPAAPAGHPEVAYAAAVTGPSTMAIVLCRDADAFYDYLAGRIGALPGVLGAGEGARDPAHQALRTHPAAPRQRRGEPRAQPRTTRGRRTAPADAAIRRPPGPPLRCRVLPAAGPAPSPGPPC